MSLCLDKLKDGSVLIRLFPNYHMCIKQNSFVVKEKIYIFRVVVSVVIVY